MKIYSACTSVASNLSLEERFAKAIINCPKRENVINRSS
jgi:hypothetical protein